MKNQISSFRPSWKRLFGVRQPASIALSAPCTKVSLHLLVNQLLSGLQPLAMKKGNVILNGIPNGLAFVAEENKLAYALWDLINRSLNGRRNECIHIISLVADDATTICVKDRAHDAEISFSISNNFLAA